MRDAESNTLSQGTHPSVLKEGSEQSITASTKGCSVSPLLWSQRGTKVTAENNTLPHLLTKDTSIRDRHVPQGLIKASDLAQLPRNTFSILSAVYIGRQGKESKEVAGLVEHTESLVGRDVMGEAVR